MSDLAAFLSVSHSNSFYFTNASNNDVLLYPETSNQTIHIGITSNASSVLVVASNIVTVVGDLSFTGTLRQGAAAYQGSQWSNSDSNVFIMGSNIVIGASNTTRALKVVGDVEFTSNVYLGQQLNFRGLKVLPFSNTPLLNMTSAVTAVQGLSNDTNGINLILPSALNASYLRVIGGATELVRLTGDGLLGIGTSVPTSALHLYSNAAVGITLCNNATGGMPAYLGLSNSGDLLITSASNYSIVMQTSNIERMRVNSNGFVGIGTVFPTSALHLNSNAAASVIVTLCNSTTGGMPLRIGLSNTGDMVLACASNFGMSFQTSNVERMRITSNGNVGIGNVSPLENLSVVGNVSLSNTSSKIVLNTMSNALVTQSGLSEKPASGQTISGSQNSFTVTTAEGNVILSSSANYQAQNTYTFGSMYSGGNPWVSTISAYNTSYPYSLSSTSINTSGMGYGHWMQVQLPVAAVLRSFFLNGSTLYSFGIGGSTDGTNFTLIQSWYNLMSPNKLFTITSANTTAYTYYRLVIFAANDGGNRAAWVQSFRLFFATQTLTIPGNIGMSNGYGYAELSSSSSNIVANSFVAGAITTGTINSIGSITTMSGYIGDAGFWSWGALYQSNTNLVPLPANSVGVLSAYINYASAQGLWWVQYINGGIVITLIQKSGGESGNLMDLRYTNSYLEYFNSTGGSSGPSSGRTGAWNYTRFM